MNRRHFLGTGAGAAMLAGRSLFAASNAITLGDAHEALLRARHSRIVMQHDVFWVLLNYLKMHPEEVPPFEPFRDAVFGYVDEPGSQIDAIWWDIGGNPVGSVYPSAIFQPEIHPLVKRWHESGVDWRKELINETRRRKRETFWNHRISEVDILPEGGHAKEPNPLKVQHPDWVMPVTWWPHGMWNLAAAGLREQKVSVLRELATRFDLDGIQIDFARHVPCLPVGRQWEMREHVTEFMRMTRIMLQEVAQERGRPFLLAARVPQTLAGCQEDGFDIREWSDQRLVDILTLGSRTMDVDVEGIREAVGSDIQLQPCFDDHHATDGYRYAPIEYVRGVFANHFQRGADSVVTFNWSMATPELAKTVGGEIAPLTHQIAFQEIGDPATLAGKDKAFAVERRGGYPWADGFFNRNDTAPLPMKLDGSTEPLILHVSDSPSDAELMLRCVFFEAAESDLFEIRWNGAPLTIRTMDATWKDAQIFSPKPQPASGGKGIYKINPGQVLLCVECTVKQGLWKRGTNEVVIRWDASGDAAGRVVQLEKVEAHLKYSPA
jgi:hypothetical protein